MTLLPLDFGGDEKAPGSLPQGLSFTTQTAWGKPTPAAPSSEHAGGATGEGRKGAAKGRPKPPPVAPADRSSRHRHVVAPTATGFRQVRGRGRRAFAVRRL
jgi:hypothetical protein